MPRKKSKSKSRCRHGSKVDGGCKRKPGPKKGSRRSRKSVTRFIGPCKHGLVKDGSRCRKRPLRRSRRRSKSTAFNTCMYGLVKDGSRCRKRPAPKRSRSRKRSSRKRKSRRCKYGLLKDGSRCRKRPAPKRSRSRSRKRSSRSKRKSRRSTNNKEWRGVKWRVRVTRDDPYFKKTRLIAHLELDHLKTTKRGSVFTYTVKLKNFRGFYQKNIPKWLKDTAHAKNNIFKLKQDLRSYDQRPFIGDASYRFDKI